MSPRIAAALRLIAMLIVTACGTGNSRAPRLLASSDWRATAPSPSGPLQLLTEPGEIPRLQLAGDAEQRLSLEHTQVRAKLLGFVAEVEVSQIYSNPFKEPIEAVYVFPLPENSAVHHLRMAIDERVIEAKINERSLARRIYQRAKEQGHTAALLEQERPNVFTQSVANIAPGKKIEVVVRYVQDLSYDSGLYEFVFPLVVGPRFMPGTATGEPQSGTGTHPDTSEVPDASRISPPYVGQGQRSGRDVAIELTADPTVSSLGFEAPTHEVETARNADGTLRVRLAERASVPNRDFVFRYRVSGAEPRATLYLDPRRGSGTKEEGFFALRVAPPNLDVDALVGQREIIFVVDVSGSMSGVPLSMCKTAMRNALRRLRPFDTFNILTFSGRTQRAFAAPRPANNANVRAGLAVLEGLRAGGGTYMADAVAAALSPTIAEGRHRYVFFLTDGYVGNEDAIISAARKFTAAAEKGGQRARVFGFGIGSSVNRHLIEGLSDAGRGVAVYAQPRENPLIGVDRFFHYIDRAVLENLQVLWGDMQPGEVYPNRIPDLFASHPIILHGRYRGRPKERLWIRAQTRNNDMELPVEVVHVPEALARTRALGTLWASEKVSELENEFPFGATTRDAIIKIGLEFNLVTRFTSLVAVDESRRVSNGSPRAVVEPLDEPEGVNVEMAGGERASLASFRDSIDGALMMGPISGSEVRSRRGCGCQLPDDASQSKAAPMLVGLLFAAGLLARRRRSS